MQLRFTTRWHTVAFRLHQNKVAPCRSTFFQQTKQGFHLCIFFCLGCFSPVAAELDRTLGEAASPPSDSCHQHGGVWSLRAETRATKRQAAGSGESLRTNSSPRGTDRRSRTKVSRARRKSDFFCLWVCEISIRGAASNLRRQFMSVAHQVVP